VLILESLQPADPAAHDYSKPIAINLFNIDATINHRLFCGSHRQLSITICPPDIFWIVKKLFGIEVPNFATDSAIVIRGVESLNELNPAHSVLEIAPKLLDIVANRRDYAEACDNNPTIFHQREPIPTLCTV
jgi:hypothetical protein